MRKKNKNKYYKNNIYSNNKGNAMLNRNIRHAFDKESEWWVDFDKRGNITHKRQVYRSDELKGKVLEFWVTYNEMGNETHYIRNDGFEYWCNYNKDGNILHYWDTNGYSEDYTYYQGVAYCNTSNGDKFKRIFDKVKDTPITIYNF